MSISTATFSYLARLVCDQSAIVLDNGKRYLLENRLAPLLASEGLTSIEELAEQLRRDRFSHLRSRVVDAMTNKETWFFRDSYPFDALKQIILPQLIAQREPERTLRLWSAGASSGQEIYSVAMLIDQNFPGLLSWNLQLLGTDISEQALARARQGRYSQWEVKRGLSCHLLAKYFAPAGADWILSHSVREMVEFRTLNLSANWPRMEPFDVILLRNVLMYLSAPARKHIMERMRRALRPDGTLFLGSAESTLNLDSGFERAPYQRYFYYQPKR